MPNYSNNTIVIYGNANNVLAVLNKAVRNCGGKNKKTIDGAISFLNKNAYVVSGSTTNHDPKSPNKGIMTITKEKGLYMGTFLKTPKTFMQYDTTNYPNIFKDAARYQREKYGVVGWYDYNRLRAFGCKWDAELTITEVVGYDFDKARIVLTCDTVWSMPTLFLHNLKKAFPEVNIGIFAHEESDAFFGYCTDIDGGWEDRLDLFDSLEQYAEDEDWDTYHEGQAQIEFDVINEFLSECV